MRFIGGRSQGKDARHTDNCRCFLLCRDTPESHENALAEVVGQSSMLAVGTYLLGCIGRENYEVLRTEGVLL